MESDENLDESSRVRDDKNFDQNWNDKQCKLYAGLKRIRRCQKILQDNQGNTTLGDFAQFVIYHQNHARLTRAQQTIERLNKRTIRLIKSLDTEFPDKSKTDAVFNYINSLPA